MLLLGNLSEYQKYQLLEAYGIALATGVRLGFQRFYIRACSAACESQNYMFVPVGLQR